VDLNKRFDRLGADIVGGHITTLSNWLREKETQIIEFVQQPTAIKGTITLSEITLVENVCFATLNGEITTNAPTNKELYIDLIRASRSGIKWSDQGDQVQGTRSLGWVNLVKRIPAEDVKSCRDQWLQQINLPQGSSTDVRFINAAKAFDEIEKVRINQLGFIQETLPTDTDYAIWDRYCQIYGDLQKYYQRGVNEEQDELRSLLRNLGEMLGNEEPERVFQEISSLFSTLRDHSIGYSFKERHDLTASQLKDIQESLSKVVAENKDPNKAFGLSAAQKPIQKLRIYLQYLGDMIKQVSEIEQALSRELRTISVIAFNEQLIHQTEKRYEDVERILLETVDIPKEGEADQ
jgi:hypothetical protein